MRKISVILPCYNMAPYVERAIQSLLHQQYTNVEIIAIDDGSTDDTLAVLNKIKQVVPNIQIFNQKNQGYGTAVNTGIQNATGDYIAILEPDDFIDNDYYYPLIAAAEGLWADVVFYNSYFECRKGFRDRLVSLYQPKRFTGSMLLSNEEICTRLALGNVGICFALYRKSFLIENNILLDMQSRAYEDVPFVASILNMAEKVAIIAGGGYYYNRDIPGQSVTNQYRFTSILKVTEQFFHDRKLKLSRAAAIRGYFLKHLAVYWNKANNNPELRSCILELMANIAHKKILLCEEWTYEFIQKQLPNVKFNKEKFPLISSSIIPLKDFPPLLKVLNEGSYFQFIGFARYKLTRMLEENIPTNAILNEIYCLLNIPAIENNTIFQKFITLLLRREEFSTMFRSSNAVTVKLMAKARKIGIIPDLSVYCEDYNFTRFLIEDMQLADYPELENIKSLENVYRFFIDSKHNINELLNYICGKSIAIVGNSPCELNKHKGEHIDSHDIVFRFNNFEISNETQDDYGKKTTVWACTPTLESLKFRENAGCINFVILPKSNSYIPKYRLDYLINLHQAGIKIGIFDTISYMQKYDIRVFSLGLLVILWLAEHKDIVKSISIYGFSLTDQLDGIKHYFSGDPSAGKLLSFHKWSKEALILNTLLKEGVIKQC